MGIILIYTGTQSLGQYGLIYYLQHQIKAPFVPNFFTSPAFCGSYLIYPFPTVESTEDPSVSGMLGAGVWVQSLAPVG